MISLSTGLPGAGKTLYTIAFVKNLAEKESRPVFYSGIKDLALPWHEIEAEKWMDCPDGAIIVIDECQRIFRPRGSGAKVPTYVSELETHRHKGFDIFLVTQHPMLMDSNVRRLTERHWHIARRFGMQRTTIFQYESCKEQPLSNTATAQRIEWKYPKEVFNYYKSAEVHTVKRRIPMQYFLMFLVPLIVIAVAWFFIQRHYQNGKMVVPGAEELSQKTEPSKSDPKIAHNAPASDKKKPMTQAEYLEAYAPRINGLAYTAPIYDEVTKPIRAPLPVGAVVFKGKCRAYTDQGTPLDMQQDLCKQIASHGFYREFDNKPEQKLEVAANKETPKNPQAIQNLPLVQEIPASTPTTLTPIVKPGQTADANTSDNPKWNSTIRG